MDRTHWWQATNTYVLPLLLLLLLWQCCVATAFYDSGNTDIKTLLLDFSTSQKTLDATQRQNDAIASSRKIQLIQIFLFPVIFAIGSVSNMLIVAVIMRRKTLYRQSVYFYVNALAVFDEAVLVLVFLKFWLFLHTGHSISGLSDMSCKLVSLAFSSIIHMCAWLPVLIVVDRFIVASWPLYSPLLCTLPKAHKAAGIFALTILTLNSHIMHTHVLRRHGEATYRCELKHADYFVKYLYIIYSVVLNILIICYNTSNMVILNWNFEGDARLAVDRHQHLLVCAACTRRTVHHGDRSQNVKDSKTDTQCCFLR